MALGVSFVTIGTAKDVPETEEEDIARRKKAEFDNQVVKDQQGRRRFHGAFTGGFSAGFFNTVGTKEGWAPSTFVSSRSSKIDSKFQRPEDFMDDEDFDVFGIAPRNVVATEPFAGEKDVLELERKRRNPKPEQSLLAPLETLIRPTKMTIGMTLLNKMGWKEGQGIGPRVTRKDAGIKTYGCMLLSGEEPDANLFAPRDVDVVDFLPKDNVKGIGYQGLDPSAALHQHKTKEAKTFMGISGQGFGTGALEEEDEDDVYGVDHLSNYSKTIDVAGADSGYSWTGAGIGGVIDDTVTVNNMFRQVPKGAGKKKVFQPPLLPDGYKPRQPLSSNRVDAVTDQANAGGPGRKLDAQQRARILGESPVGQGKSVFGLISAEDRQRLLSIKGSISQGRKPVVESQEGRTEWQRKQDEKEKEKYKRVAQNFKPLASMFQSRFTPSTEGKPKSDEKPPEEKISQEESDTKAATAAAKMKMFGLLTRQILDWHPDRLLCRRFNVPDPYTRSSIVGVPKLHKSTSMLGNFINVERLVGSAQPTQKKEDEKPVERKLEFQKALESKPASGHSAEKTGEESEEVEKDFERPSMDIFKAVFGESDGEEEEEEAEAEEKEDKKEENMETNVLDNGKTVGTPEQGNQRNDGLPLIQETTNPNAPKEESDNLAEELVDKEADVTDASFGPAPPPVSFIVFPCADSDSSSGGGRRHKSRQKDKKKKSKKRKHKHPKKS
eukprot:m.105978 g.105978  ORF g.105978 m.105978 type:complete len:722 (+) comp37240_c1_seq6:2850-5015(+)